MCVCAVAVTAQPELRVLQTHVVWPRVEIAFEKYCAGVLDTSMTKGPVTAHEFGLAVDSLHVSAPGDSCPNGIAVALVLDGNRMQGAARFENVREGSMRFLEGLDGICDRASVNQYDQSTRRNMSAITSVDSLRGVLSSLNLGGGSGARMDALYTAIMDLSQYSEARARAILVTASSTDVGSTHKQQEIITLARQHRVRIFAIGSGGGAPVTELSALSTQSGGQLYAAYDRDQFLSVFANAFTALRRYAACTVLTYSGICADGLVREVVLRADSMCGGTAIEHAWYSPSLDGNDLQTAELRLSEAAPSAGGRSVLRVSLPSLSKRTVLHPAEFRVEFDTSLARLDSISIPPDSPLASVALWHRPNDQGSIVSIIGSTYLSAFSTPSTFVDIHFTSASCVDSSRSLQVKISRWVFERGCLQIRDAAADIQLTRPDPVPVSDMRDSITLAWDAAGGTYSPNPCILRYRMKNIGAVPARLASFRFEYDSTSFLHADSDSVWNDSRVISAGGSVYIERRFHARASAPSGTYGIRLVLVFEHDDTVYCDAVVRLMQQGPLVEVHGTSVRGGRVELRYRAYCDGMQQTAEGAAHVSVNGRQAVVSSITCQGESTDCILLYEDPCPDGGTDTVDLRIDSLCASSAKVVFVTTGADVPWRIQVDGDRHICPGETAQLDMGDEPIEYIWDTGERTRRLTVHTEGSYGGWVRFADGCRLRTEPVRITASQRPRLTPGGVIVLCPNGVETVGTGAQNASYVWSTGETSQVIDVQNSGMYHVRVIDSHGCEMESDTLRVIANEPIVPRIHPDGPIHLQPGASQTLVVDPGYAVYTWNTGSPSDHITVTKPGIYYADVTPWGGGCSARTQYVQVDMTTTIENTESPAHTLVLFPDPVASSLTLRLPGSTGTTSAYHIIDALGREVKAGVVYKTASIDVRSWPRGVYTAVVRSGRTILTRQFIVVY